MKLKSILLTVAILLGLANGVQAREEIQTLPIQDGGRVKPFDTFARESLKLVYGQDKYGGQPSHQIVLTWLLQPELWNERDIFEIRYNEIKTFLKLAGERRHFSRKEILSSDRLSLLFQQLNAKRQAKEKLDPFYQSAQRLEGQLYIFQGIAQGELMKIQPPNQGDNWQSLNQMTDENRQLFAKVTEQFVKVLASDVNDKSSVADKRQQFDQAVVQFKTAMAGIGKEDYPSSGRINTEVHFNEFHPFRIAWIFYLLGALSLLLIWVFKREQFVWGGWVFSILGLLFHIYGFALRVYLTDRPPVSNMYETVVWVGFGAVFFAMIIEALYKWRFVLMSGAIVAAFCLILGDLAPTVLDPSLQPLEPVLRNNFWLLVHVLTITISYAAFFLAFVLGDVGLFYYLNGEEKNAAKIKAIVLAIYRCFQIGVSLLAPGIILGGVWADYSWGRFWGWDPKETWALIALLGYVAVLHGRLSGWIKDFGMVCTAILTFSLVIMAWYGVNFVLGAGLHSYGFGAGGIEYVSVFIFFHMAYVAGVTIFRAKKVLK